MRCFRNRPRALGGGLIASNAHARALQTVLERAARRARSGLEQADPSQEARRPSSSAAVAGRDERGL